MAPPFFSPQSYECWLSRRRRSALAAPMASNPMLLVREGDIRPGCTDAQLIGGQPGVAELR